MTPWRPWPAGNEHLNIGSRHEFQAPAGKQFRHSGLRAIGAATATMLAKVAKIVIHCRCSLFCLKKLSILACGDTVWAARARNLSLTCGTWTRAEPRAATQLRDDSLIDLDTQAVTAEALRALCTERPLTEHTTGSVETESCILGSWPNLRPYGATMRMGAKRAELAL